MRKGGKGKVEVVLDLGVLEAGGLGDGGPDVGQILDQGVAQVCERGDADMVADNEEEEGAGLVSKLLVSEHRLGAHHRKPTAYPSRTTAC